MTRRSSPPLKRSDVASIYAILVFFLVAAPLICGGHWLQQQPKPVTLWKQVAAAKPKVTPKSKDARSAPDREHNLLSVLAPPYGAPPDKWKPKGEMEEHYMAEYAKGASL